MAYSVSRACDLSVSSGEIFLISELSYGCAQGPQEGSSVKLLGRLEEHSPTTFQARLALDGHSIEINTRLLGGVVLREGYLYQFIGELESAEHGLYLNLYSIMSSWL